MLVASPKNMFLHFWKVANATLAAPRNLFLHFWKVANATLAAPRNLFLHFWQVAKWNIGCFILQIHLLLKLTDCMSKSSRFACANVPIVCFMFPQHQFYTSWNWQTYTHVFPNTKFQRLYFVNMDFCGNGLMTMCVCMFEIDTHATCNIAFFSNWISELWHFVNMELCSNVLISRCVCHPCCDHFT